MKLVRAQSTDGRVLRAVNGGWHTTRAALAAKPAAPSPIESLSPSLARILRPAASVRWLLPYVGSITPQYIEMVLRGALAGNHVQQWELFDLMLDTWPELSACQQELRDGVMARTPLFEPFAEEDADPTPAAIERCQVVSAALRRMSPDPAADENAIGGTIADLVDGWFRGVSVLEVDWAAVPAGVLGQIIAPRASYWVHPVCFAWDQGGRLGLRVEASGAMQGSGLGSMSAQPQPSALTPFPRHKFLIGIHKQKSGSALGGALLRPLAWWWCAANFSADWLLNLAQVFGLPFRWANYDPNAPQATIDAICNMLQNMGSAGWAAFPAGTTLELKDQPKGSDHSPQGELLDRADRYARLVILGQTMSGSQDASKGGGKAFGAVEADVKAQRIAAAASYVADVLNTQLLRSIVTLNYGAADEAPLVSLVGAEDLEQRASIVAQLASAGAGKIIGLDWLGETFRIPRPGPGEETLEAEQGEEEMEDEVFEDEEEGDAAPLASGEASGHPFRGNQHTAGKGGSVNVEVSSLKDFFFKLKNDPHAKLQVKIGNLSTRAQQRISKALGRKVNELWTTADEYRHAFRHKELTERDWHELPEFLRKADIIRRGVTKGGERAVEVWRKGKAWRLVVGTGHSDRVYVRTFKNVPAGPSPLKSKRATDAAHTQKGLACTPKAASVATGGGGIAPGHSPRRQDTPTASRVKGVEATLSRVLAIKDDALFAKALAALAQTL